MRLTGKQGWQAHYKDTFSLDCPIILAALKKFREQLYKDYSRNIIIIYGGR